MRRSKTFRLYVSGPNACFSRPELKVERVSYEIPTPSAMRGILEAIFWKPAFVWVIEKVEILKPIVWENIRRNEIDTKASMRSDEFFIEDHRQQRASLVLKNVTYIIHAHQRLTGKYSETNDIPKLSAMFERRVQKGQCFHRPYLGTREFAVEEFSLVNKESLKPIDQSKDLGWMLYDLDFSKKPPQPLYFYAKIKKGVVEIPSPESEEIKR